MIFISFHTDYGSKYWMFTTISNLSTHTIKTTATTTMWTRVEQTFCFIDGFIRDFIRALFWHLILRLDRPMYFNRNKKMKRIISSRYLFHYLFLCLIIKKHIYILCIKLMENSCTTFISFIQEFLFDKKMLFLFVFWKYEPKRTRIMGMERWSFDGFFVGVLKIMIRQLELENKKAWNRRPSVDASGPFIEKSRYFIHKHTSMYYALVSWPNSPLFTKRIQCSFYLKIDGRFCYSTNVTSGG